LVGLVATKVYSAAGADIVMESITLTTWRGRETRHQFVTKTKLFFRL
jgi:hypothetical protein